VPDHIGNDEDQSLSTLDIVVKVTAHLLTRPIETSELVSG
jgi:hypothetical protein